MGILVVDNSQPNANDPSDCHRAKDFCNFGPMNNYTPPHPPLSCDMHGHPVLPPQPSPQHALQPPVSSSSAPPPPECWQPGPSSPDPGIPPHGSSCGPSPPPLCAGCSLRIMDKFYLSAMEGKWHTSCLKCSECGVELENQLSCFERDRHIYCKEDYIRIYVNKCARCLLEIQSSDLVMKARQNLFHVGCFRCATCDTVLKKGDLFGMYDDVLYCRLHFELISSGHHVGITSIPPPPPPPQPPQGTSFTPDPMGHSPVDGQPYQPLPMGYHPGGFPPQPPQQQQGGPGGPPPGWFPAGPGCPGDFPMGEFPYENNNEPMLKKRRGRKKRKVESFAAMNGYLEGYPPGMDGQAGQGKTKRARTSFKHHQLRIMKAHFQINQNPDSRELKMLSQKTQLDKKVLQVWFQNARAKWRRTRAQDGQGGNGNGGNPGGSATAISAATSVGGGSSGMGGDDGDLALGSPSSDCSGPMIPCC